jgi:hypothetical protein
VSPAQLIQRIQQSPDEVQFAEVMDTITRHYDYTPTRFENGPPEDRVINQAGQNEGSCKLFAFAQLHGLDQTQTLACFGDYYRRDVLAHPDGQDHANIRNFMRYGWHGIHFAGPALSPKADT